LPIKSIVGIYAQENGQGMIFQVEHPVDPGPSGPGPVKSVPSSDKLSKDKISGDKTKKPSLRIVK
jgi:stringent starvation protein B